MKAMKSMKSMKSTKIKGSAFTPPTLGSKTYTKKAKKRGEAGAAGTPPKQTKTQRKQKYENAVKKKADNAKTKKTTATSTDAIKKPTSETTPSLEKKVKPVTKNPAEIIESVQKQKGLVANITKKKAAKTKKKAAKPTAAEELELIKKGQKYRSKKISNLKTEFIRLEEEAKASGTPITPEKQKQINNLKKNHGVLRDKYLVIQKNYNGKKQIIAAEEAQAKRELEPKTDNSGLIKEGNAVPPKPDNSALTKEGNAAPPKPDNSGLIKEVNAAPPKEFGSLTKKQSINEQIENSKNRKKTNINSLLAKQKEKQKARDEKEQENVAKRTTTNEHGKQIVKKKFGWFGLRKIFSQDKDKKQKRKNERELQQLLRKSNKDINKLKESSRLQTIMNKRENEKQAKSQELTSYITQKFAAQGQNISGFSNKVMGELGKKHKKEFKEVKKNEKQAAKEQEKAIIQEAKALEKAQIESLQFDPNSPPKTVDAVVPKNGDATA